MATAKKGVRRITVEGVEYCWLVYPQYDYESGLMLVVELASYPGERMATLVESGSIISPGLVRKAILHALTKGWQPNMQGESTYFRSEEIISRSDDSEPLLITRLYRADDYERVWNLHNLDSARAWTHGGRDKWASKLQHEIDRGVFIVGYLTEQIVAIASFTTSSDKEAQIGKMQVHPDFQRRGYGQQMLKELEISVRKSGYKTLSLHVNSLQTEAQKLFGKNGYSEIARKPWRSMERIYFEKRF